MRRHIVLLGASSLLSALLFSLTGCSGGGGGSTTSTTTTTTPPVVSPIVSSVTPAAVGAGSVGITLTVNGTNFISGSTVQVGTVAEATTYVSATQLTALVPAAQLTTGALLPVVVLNGSATSASGTAMNLEVDNPAPTITSFTPVSFTTASSSTTVSIVGKGFVPATTINVNGTSRSTSYVSATQVNTILTVADLAGAGNLNITAVNPAPGGGTSAASSLPVNNPVPTITALTPTAAIAGNTNTTPVAVTGTNFVAGSTVLVGTSARATAYVSATQLTTALTVADVAAAGKLSLSVVNPAPGGGTSNIGTITVTAPTLTPVLSSLSPSSFVVGSGPSYMLVYGTNLNLNCQILWNSTPLSFSLSSGSTYVNGTYVFSTYASATIPASLLATTGTASITANCPTALVPVSNALSVSIVNPPVPTLTTIYPASGAINTSIPVTFTGSGFTSKTTISYNGAALPTTFVSSTSLTATLPASMNLLPGNGSFTAVTPAPGGGTSAVVPFTAYVSIVNNDMIFNPVNGLYYASVPSSAGQPYGNTVVSIDPATGAIGTPISVGSEPNRLAVTSDGKYLWVGLDGANAVRKVDLTAGKAGLQFTIPQAQLNSVGGSNAYALAALPGATDSVIVSSADFPNYFAIYDSGVVRGSPISGYYTQPYAIAADGSKNEVYASGSNGYQTFTYSASGLTLKTTTTSGISVQSGGDMQVTGGKVYPSNGKVYDAESGALQGTLYTMGSTIASGSTYADTSLNKIFVVDSSTNYYYGQNQVQIFSASDYTSGSAVSFNLDPNSLSTPTRLTRWGSNGLAFRTGTALYSFRSNLIKDLSGVSADLGVSLTSSGITTSAPITFVATVTNNGSAAATNVTLAGFLPSNGALTSVSTSTGNCSTVANLTCDLGSLSNGASATITVSIQPAAAGNLVFATQVSGSENDPTSSNNNASLTVAVTGANYNPPPVLSSISPAAIKAGSADATLTLNGTGFVSGTTVQLGSTTLVASLVSSTQMTASVPAANLAAMGWSPVTMSNSSPGGGSSAAIPLTVFNVVTAGLNHIAYEPFSRKIYTSVGSGSSNLTGNSIAQLTPETGTFNTPVSIGSQPTRFGFTSDGNYLYATLSGANSIARFNLATNTTEFTFSPTLPTNYYSANPGLVDVAAQPGSDTVLAVNYGYYSGIGLVDVNTTNKTGTLRGTTTSSYYSTAASSMQFADPNTLFIYDGSLEKYPVPAAGLAYNTTHTGTYLQNFSTFTLSGKYAFSDLGGFADVSGSAPVQVGYFRPLASFYTSGQKVAADADLGRAFFASATSNSSFNPDGIVVYDQTTQLPVLTLPLNIGTIEGTGTYSVVDLIRWEQDGLALLTSTGHVYLLRGAAVVPQLLNTNSVATITAVSSTSTTHGAGNTLLTLTGSNFVPGVAIQWNGSYRTTTIVDATHVTVAIPAADLANAGTATLTAVNPGASASSGLTFTIN